MESLTAYSWPGNLAELEKEIKQACFSEPTGSISPEHFRHLKFDKRRFKATLDDSLKEQKKRMVAVLEKEAIAEALKRTQGNRSRAAILLAISRQELIRKIALHKIKL